uniref:Disease resistance protein homolog n=1 Tax=Arabidopsis thaliana TaxID=3702 RepID=Q8RWB5_ARATH|nr:disease resistance protein homolog [Arabidopsis thaliana]
MLIPNLVKDERYAQQTMLRIADSFRMSHLGNIHGVYVSTWQPQLLQNSDSNKTTNILNLLLYLFHLLQLQCLESGNTTSSRASTGQMFEKPFLVTSSNRSEERELTHLLIII